MAKRKSTDNAESSGAEGSPDALHPRATAVFFGHASAEEAFLRAFRAGTLHHAWLITGEMGIGKATFAYRAARFLLSRGGEDISASDEAGTLDLAASHPVSRQMAAGAHPSLFVLGERRGESASTASIGVDAVRKLRAFMNLTSPAGWRAMIVDPANDLTIASANALLKAIEEPPPRTVFFLINHGAAAVMPTIRSRCVHLALRPPQQSEFESALAAACSVGGMPMPTERELAKLYAAWGASPGQALDLLAGGLLPFADKVEKIIAGLPYVDYGLVHGLIQSSIGARNAENFHRLCDLLEKRIEKQARQEAIENEPGNMNGARWAHLWQALRERRSDMEALNLDKGAFLMTTFSDMETITQRP
jgi:DNA polymerase III subunit delta'